MTNILRVDKTTLLGMGRYKELMNEKRFVKIAEKYENYLMAFGMFEEFKYLTNVIRALVIELQNCNNLYKLIDLDLKSSITFFKEFIMRNGANTNRELENEFLARYNAFNEINKSRFIATYQDKYGYVADTLNSLANVMLIVAKQFAAVLNNLNEKEQYIINLNKITDFMELIRDKIKPKKVSKYQQFVGTNLKNWNK